MKTEGRLQTELLQYLCHSGTRTARDSLDWWPVPSLPQACKAEHPVSQLSLRGKPVQSL